MGAPIGGGDGSGAHSPYANMPSMGAPMASSATGQGKGLTYALVGCGCLAAAAIAVVLVLYFVAL
jgi:hypothetical protein